MSCKSELAFASFNFTWQRSENLAGLIEGRITKAAIHECGSTPAVVIVPQYKALASKSHGRESSQSETDDVL